MCDLMPKAQFEFVTQVKNDMLKNTNMNEDEAWDFGFRCWQCGYAKTERGKTNADYIRSLPDGELAHFLMDFKDNFDGSVYDWLKGVRE